MPLLLTESEVHEIDALDAVFGFEKLASGSSRIGWLLNMCSTTVFMEDKTEYSALDLYFLRQDGSTFKGTFLYKPYFYIKCKVKVGI